MSVLSRCTTLDPEVFRTQVFGRRRLHTPAADLPAGFDDLLTVADLDALLASGLRTTSIRLVKGGVESSSGGVLDPGDDPGQPGFVDPDAVRTALDGGHTLILRGLHRYHPPLRRFAHQLSAELGFPVLMNAFVTPPHSTGVLMHYDPQDVLVIQVAGAKHWSLHDPLVTDPVPATAWFTLSSAEQQELRSRLDDVEELVLRPGDTLYFPRGTFHAPRTQEEWSVHLTVGIPKLTRHDLLQSLVDRAVQDAGLRASVRLDDLADPADVRSELVDIAERLRKLAGAVDAEEATEVAEATRSRLWRVQPAEPIGALTAGRVAAERIRGRAGVRVVRRPVRDGLRVGIGARQVTLPAWTGRLLERLDTGSAVDVGSLAGAFDVAPAEAAAVARALLTLGVALPAELSDAGPTPVPSVEPEPEPEPVPAARRARYAA